MVYGDLLPVVRLYPVIRQKQTAAAASITQNNAMAERRRHAPVAHGVMVQPVLRIRFAAAVRVSLAQVVSMLMGTAV